MKSNGTLVKAYLGGSASVQKTRAKLRGPFPGERCQGAPAVGRLEEARSRCRAGLLLGLDRGRASPYRAKPVSPALSRGLLGAIHAVNRSQTTQVLHAIMSEQWPFHSTGEVPLCLRLLGGVTDRHKASPKRGHHALVSRTASAWPRLQGSQRCRSRCIRTERQNLRELVGQDGFTGKVSQRIEATTWPTGTSFRKTLCILRNVLLRFIFVQRAVHPRLQTAT